MGIDEILHVSNCRPTADSDNTIVVAVAPAVANKVISVSMSLQFFRFIGFSNRLRSTQSAVTYDIIASICSDHCY